MFDFLIIGAGFAGAVVAERLASQLDARVLIVDQRNHIGGNAYDHYNEAGILVHKYGPHIFHTNSERIFEYLSNFTQWRPYEHRVQASVDGQLVPMPINADTLNKIYGLKLNCHQVERYLSKFAEHVDEIKTSRDAIVSKVGRDLYERFFRNYTRKQWGLDPSELDASVTSRVPIRSTRDDRYFTDRFQAMPMHGYTRMFERMLAHPKIHVLLNTSYKDIRDEVRFGELIYTGRIDEYFDYCCGELPYRSLHFEHQTHDKQIYQPAPVVNYPNEHAYTRITEFKYLTGQEHPKTSIVFEYPRAKGDPYYPIPRAKNAELYRQYQLLAEALPRVHFVGRLATYKYYNMDQVTAQALATFEKLAGRKLKATRTIVAMPDDTGLTPASTISESGEAA
jgi:UDP-galactopyranose mutase